MSGPRYRGDRTDVSVPAPRGDFSALAVQELSLDAVKRRYVQAVFFWNRSISKTAKVLGVDRNTVYAYLGEPVDTGCELRKLEAEQ